MEYKFDNTDYFSTQEFHNDREEADHINQPNHRPRLLEVASLIEELCKKEKIKSWIDYGCGNGGLLSVVDCVPHKKGYDFMPKNVEAAQKLGRPVTFKNFLEDEPEKCDLATATEVMEHLQDPHGFVRKLKCKYLIVSTPEGEHPHGHYEFHVWGWNRQGMHDLLTNNGYEVMKDAGGGGTMIIVAKKI